MPSHRLAILFLTLSLFALQACSQSPAAIPAALQPEVEAVFKKVSPDSIRAVMNVLASNDYEGRKPGTRGFAKASGYVQDKLNAYGLKPAAGNGSYVQPVTFRKGWIQPAGCEMIFKHGEFFQPEMHYGKDYLLRPNFYNAHAELSADLFFVGFGISAPELKYDDYAGIDVKGKIVVFFDQAPATFPSNERAYFSSTATKYAEAVKRGAVGALSLSMADSAGWSAAGKRSQQGTYRWVGADSVVQPDFPELKIVGSLSPEGSKAFFAMHSRNWEDVVAKARGGESHPFAASLTAKIKATTAYTNVQTSNLVALIPGSDPQLKDQYVDYTAHLDHFGIGEPLNGDSIYNGAHDNASGVALLLEIARTFHQLPKAPKRSVLITIVTGEEYGLLGSDYFIHYPTVPKKDIVANMSLDMPFFFHPVLDIVPYGALHSSLNRQVEAAAGYLGLGISPDPFPEQVVFIRSDHYSFIRQGIPALFIKSGFKTVAADTVDRSRTDVEWRRTTYHTPKDDMTQAFDFNAGATHVKLNFLIGLLVCEDASRPVWNKGDFFGGRFGQP
jgi:hypothetical protein